MKERTNEELLRDIEKNKCDIQEFEIRIRRYQIKIDEKKAKERLLYQQLEVKNKK